MTIIIKKLFSDSKYRVGSFLLFLIWATGGLGTILGDNMQIRVLLFCLHSDYFKNGFSEFPDFIRNFGMICIHLSGG